MKKLNLIDEEQFVEDIYPMRLARKLARQKRIGQSMHRSHPYRDRQTDYDCDSDIRHAD